MRAGRFKDGEDRQEFLRLLGEGVERFGHSVHAYCLMGNHFHLVVRTGKTPLSVIMQNLMSRYTRYVQYQKSSSLHLLQVFSAPSACSEREKRP